MFHHYTLTCINILICTVQGSYLASLLLHKIFFKLGLVWNATQNPNFVFLLWFLIQFLVFKERQLFVSVVIIIIIVGIMRFLSRVINYILQCFLWCLFFQNISVRYSISSLKYFSEQILVALARNPSNMLANSYLPLLFFILMSRKFKHFSSFSSSMVN